MEIRQKCFKKSPLADIEILLRKCEVTGKVQVRITQQILKIN